MIRDDWRTLGIYYGIGVITMMDEGNYDDADGTEAWKSFRVQWNDDFTWHSPEELELISEDS
jgi:hypothetical protein